MIAIYPAQKRSHHSNLISSSFRRDVFRVWAYRSVFCQRPTAKLRGYILDKTFIINLLNTTNYGAKFK